MAGMDRSARTMLILAGAVLLGIVIGRAAGGLLVGLVIGVLIGLAIAYWRGGRTPRL